MLQRDVVQFYERGWANAQTEVQVVGGDATVRPIAVRAKDDEEAPWVVGRLELWGAGLRLALQRPLLGFGPDNFRHFYGTELGLDSWDERVQANNVYLELLVDLGILGLAAFLWQVIPVTARSLRGRNSLSICLGLSLLAFLVHGLLDSFLVFTPTALLFWIVLGLAQKPQVSGR
jgi:O-antigen ligase